MESEGKVLDETDNLGKFNLEDVDELGSSPATQEELLEWEQKIKILAFKEKGRFRVALKNTQAYRYMQKNKVTAFFDGKEIPPIIWYSEGSSNYVIAHEYYHLEEYCKIGREAFIKGDLGSKIEGSINNILRERYVAERLLENAEKLKLSENELKHIKQYYNDILIDEHKETGVEIISEYLINFEKYGL